MPPPLRMLPFPYHTAEYIRRPTLTTTESARSATTVPLWPTQIKLTATATVWETYVSALVPAATLHHAQPVPSWGHAVFVVDAVHQRAVHDAVGTQQRGSVGGGVLLPICTPSPHATTCR
jgi:hypothetical protein